LKSIEAWCFLVEDSSWRLLKPSLPLKNGSFMTNLNTTTMKAAVRDQYGDPSILRIEQVEIPNPKPKEILIKIHATTVNRTDVGVLRGMPLVFRFFTGLFKPRYRSTGTDFAGEVVGAGHQVTHFKVGDRVWGFLDEGLPTHAAYFAMPEQGNVTFIPNNWDFDQIVACAEGAHYARNLSLQPGQKALVYGATGAIGSALLQMLKAQGIYATAVCPTRQVEVIRSLGPDKVLGTIKRRISRPTRSGTIMFSTPLAKVRLAYAGRCCCPRVFIFHQN
jgi:NADPH:quinone reductase-like Zn-dependent oxidoreductase